MGIPLLNSPAELTAAVLVQLGLATSPPSPPTKPNAWPVYASNEPSEPDNCITCYDSADQEDGRWMQGSLFTHYGIQVRVRAVDHPTDYQKAFAIKQVLATVNQQSIVLGTNSYIVHCFSKIRLAILGKNTPSSKRSISVVNALLTLS